MTEKQIPDQPGWKDLPDSSGWFWFQPSRCRNCILYRVEPDLMSDTDISLVWAVNSAARPRMIRDLRGRWFGPVDIPEPPKEAE